MTDRRENLFPENRKKKTIIDKFESSDIIKIMFAGFAEKQAIPVSHNLNTWELFGSIIEKMYKDGFVIESNFDKLCWTNGMIYVHIDEPIYNSDEFRATIIRKAAEAKLKLRKHLKKDSDNEG